MLFLFLNFLAFFLVVVVGSDWVSVTEPNAFKSTTWELLYAIVKVQYLMHWSWSEGPCQVGLWLTEDQIDHWQGIARPPLSHLLFLSCLSSDTCTLARCLAAVEASFIFDPTAFVRPETAREAEEERGTAETEEEIQGEGVTEGTLVAVERWGESRGKI